MIFLIPEFGLSREVGGIWETGGTRGDDCTLHNWYCPSICGHPSLKPLDFKESGDSDDLSPCSSALKVPH